MGNASVCVSEGVHMHIHVRGNGETLANADKIRTEIRKELILKLK